MRSLHRSERARIDGTLPQRSVARITSRTFGEGGHRVPFIVRWPGVVAPGSVNRQLGPSSPIFSPPWPTSSDGNCLPMPGRTASVFFPSSKGTTNPSAGIPSVVLPGGLPEFAGGKLETDSSAPVRAAGPKAAKTNRFNSTTSRRISVKQTISLAGIRNEWLKCRPKWKI